MAIIKKIPATPATSSNSFETISTPAGTSPVADSSTDTLSLTSSDSSVTITGTAASDTVNFATRYSNPGSGTSSERFGASVAGTGNSQVVVGNAADGKAGNNSTIIGAGATGSTNGSDVIIGAAAAGGVTLGGAVVIGKGASGQNSSVAIGFQATATGSQSVVVGTGGGSANNTIAIGAGAGFSHANTIVIGVNGSTTAQNQCNIGTADQIITDFYLGQGVTSASPSANTLIHGTGGSGTDIVGSNLILSGGKSTGAGTPPEVQIHTSTVGSTGTTLQSLTKRVFVDGTGRVGKQIGSSTSYANVGGTANVNTTAVGNITTGEDDLITYSLPANALAANNDYIEIDAFGTFAATAAAKNVKLYFGSTVISTTGAIAVNNGTWWLKAKVIRTDATAQISIASATTDNALLVSTVAYSTPAETLSGAVTIKCTGEATNTDDIIQKGLIVKYGQV